MDPLSAFRLNGDTPLTPEERRLVLRSIAIIAVPLALITFAALLVGGFFVYHELRGRTQQNRAAIKTAQDAANAAAALAIRLDEQQIASQQALEERVYAECVENENQDAAYVALFRKVRAVVAQGEPSAARDALLTALQETEDAREPPGEKDCALPGTMP